MKVKNENTTADIKISNRFIAKESIPPPTLIVTDKDVIKCKNNTNSVIHNLSKVTLTLLEKQVLEKGLNFCPTTKDIDTEKLLDDLYFFCRKLRLKEHFHNQKGYSETSTAMLSVASSNLNCVIHIITHQRTTLKLCKDIFL